MLLKYAYVIPPPHNVKIRFLRKLSTIIRNGSIIIYQYVPMYVSNPYFLHLWVRLEQKRKDSLFVAQSLYSPFFYYRSIVLCKQKRKNKRKGGNKRKCTHVL
jgi:hypothetical protein